MATQLITRLSAIAALALLATSANAAIIEYTITGGTHLLRTPASANTGGMPTPLGVYENGLGPANCLTENDCGDGYWKLGRLPWQSVALRMPEAAGFLHGQFIDPLD